MNLAVPQKKATNANVMNIGINALAIPRKKSANPAKLLIVAAFAKNGTMMIWSKIKPEILFIYLFQLINGVLNSVRENGSTQKNCRADNRPCQSFLGFFKVFFVTLSFYEKKAGINYEENGNGESYLYRYFQKQGNKFGETAN